VSIINRIKKIVNFCQYQIYAFFNHFLNKKSGPNTFRSLFLLQAVRPALLAVFCPAYLQFFVPRQALAALVALTAFESLVLAMIV
jgi:hypothetical protein